MKNRYDVLSLAGPNIPQQNVGPVRVKSRSRKVDENKFLFLSTKIISSFEIWWPFKAQSAIKENQDQKQPLESNEEKRMSKQLWPILASYYTQVWLCEA